MGEKMNKKEYLDLVKKHTPNEKRMTNAINAFLVGGLLGFIGEALKLLIVYYTNIPNKEAISWVLLIYIFIASLCTVLGIFDTLAGKFKAGILIPITGFAHSVAAAVLDYKHDGMIPGMGSNLFKLSGCVILYGVVAAFIMAIVKVMIYA